MLWSEIASAVPVQAAPPGGLWTLVVDYVEGPMLLKITVPRDNQWSYAPGKRCDADGDLRSLLRPALCLYEDAPVGSLIAKIGGSSAGRNDGMVFLAGTTCIVDIPKDTKGPLFATINDEPTGMVRNHGQVYMTVQRATKFM